MNRNFTKEDIQKAWKVVRHPIRHQGNTNCNPGEEKRKPTMSHHYAYNKMAKNKQMLAIPSAKRMHNL